MAFTLQKDHSSTFSDTKPHYPVLDGLRGVAALVVVWYHIFEAFATSPLDQTVNHGYLAVDFFFLLSGFVMGYAYDDRWGEMKVGEFLKRRVIRLHPMLVLGALLGGALFYCQVSEVWNVAPVPLLMLVGAVALNVLLLPALPSYQVRGYGEMYPLNGPSWSLFFEYLGNLLYAFVLRKLPTRWLAILVAAAGVGLAVFAFLSTDANLGAGWQLTPEQGVGGSLRLLFSFSAGLLLSRMFVARRTRGSFWIGGILLVIVGLIPRIGGVEQPWMNALYDTICVLILFPLVVFFAASDGPQGPRLTKVCKFLGELSYPLYMVHYPFVYVYYAWVKNQGVTFVQSLPQALLLFFGTILLAYLCLRWYDLPLRRWLTRRWLGSLL